MTSINTSKFQSFEERTSVPSTDKILPLLPEQTQNKQDTSTVHDDFEKTFTGNKMNQRDNFNRFKRIPMKFLMTGEISKHHGRKTYLETILREALIYGVFLTVLSILVMEDSSNDIDMFITSTVDKFVLNEIINDVTSTAFTFSDIVTIDQIWEYLNALMIIFHESNFFHPVLNLSDVESSNRKSEFQDNDLIGSPRLRTVRVCNESCKVPRELKNKTIMCFYYYRSKNEDTEPFGLKSGSAWKYKSAIETGLDQVIGVVSAYSGGGFCQDLPKSLGGSKKSLESLKTGKWIDRATRAVTVDFTIYNVNLDIFAVVNLLFEIPLTGGVIPSHTINSLNITDYRSKSMIYFGCSLAFLIFLLFYTLQKMFELIYFKWHFFRSFCNSLDLGIVIMCYIVIIINLQKNVTFKTNLENVICDDSQFVNFSKMLHAEKLCDKTESILIFLCWMKVLKYACMNHSIHRLQITLIMSLKHLVWYSVIFFYVLFIFAFTAFNLFGSQIESFNTLTSSIWNVLQVGAGEFNYNLLQDMRPYLGSIFYFLFLHAVCLIFVVVYIAILINRFAEVDYRSCCSSAEMKIGDVLKNFLVNSIKKCSHKLASRLRNSFNKSKIQKEFQGVQHLLKKYGFTQPEVDMFLAKYEISEDRVITNEDLHKIRKNFQQQEISKVNLVRKIVRQTVAEKLTALEEAVSNASTKIILILQIFDQIDRKLNNTA